MCVWIVLLMLLIEFQTKAIKIITEPVESEQIIYSYGICAVLFYYNHVLWVICDFSCSHQCVDILMDTNMTSQKPHWCLHKCHWPRTNQILNKTCLPLNCKMYGRVWMYLSYSRQYSGCSVISVWLLTCSKLAISYTLQPSLDCCSATRLHSAAHVCPACVFLFSMERNTISLDPQSPRPISTAAWITSNAEVCHN